METPLTIVLCNRVKRQQHKINHLSSQITMRKQNKKEDIIRGLLLEAVGKNPDLFCYYASLQEAKELIGKKVPEEETLKKIEKPKRIIVEC